WLRLAFVMTALYAATDEIHQLFVPGRAGRVTDVLIDCIGVAVITYLLWKER
ncbi:MAG: VanZ family protein, partial [Lachnospiraceae bacterium]|nr:VanZ family protein [Lachnospiraceae bacterium]